MPIVSGFYNSVNGDRKYDSEQFGSLFKGVFNEGVFPNVGQLFRVKAVGEGMKVEVGTGRAWLFDHWVENTGPETLTVDAAYSSSDRKDYICIVVDVSTAVRGAKLICAKTSGNAPGQLNPELQDTANKKVYKIAEISVPRGITRIGQEHIKSLVGTQLPYIAGVAEHISLNALSDRLEAEFNSWFRDVRDALAQAGGNNAADVANLKTQFADIRREFRSVNENVNSLSRNVSTWHNRLENRNTFFDLLDTTNGGTHNSIYRGDHLGSSVNAEQRKNINNGTFKGMWLGDYWQFAGVTWRIVAFDYFRGMGPQPWDRAHIVVVPDQSLYGAKWDENSDTTKGYAGSTLNKQDIGTAVNRGAQMFGGNLNSPWHRFTTKIDDGIVAELGWFGEPKAAIMNEEMIFGRNQQGYAQSTHRRTDFSFMAQGQFPAFHMNAKLITVPQYPYWIQDVANATMAWCVDKSGISLLTPANYERGIRPYYVVTA